MAPPPIIDLAKSSDVRFRDVVSRDQYQVATSGNLIRNIYHHITGDGVVNVSAMQVVSVVSNNAQFDSLIQTSTTPLLLANITTANISTWSANSLLSLRRGTTFIRSANVQVGNLIAGTITGNLASFTMLPFSEARLDNYIIRSFQGTLAAASGSGREFCSIQTTNGAYAAELNVVQSETVSSSIAKTYQFVVRNNATANNWQRLVPLACSSTGLLFAGDWAVEIKVNNATTTLRLVRVSGSATLNFECALTLYQSRTDPVTLSASSTTYSGLTPSTTVYENALLTQIRGNVGIGTDEPTALLTVNGRTSADSLVSANAITGFSVGVSSHYQDASVLAQGAYMCWNHEIGGGYTDFICKRGSGEGGYRFWLSSGDGSALSVGKTLLANVNASGITLSPGGIFSAPGSIIGSMFVAGYSAGGIADSVTISPVIINRTTYNSWTTVATFKYTPKSSTSRLYINFDIYYLIDGFGTDSMSSLIRIDNLDTYIIKQQKFTGTGGGGTRSGTLFPISNVFKNDVTTEKTITIQVNVSGSDDTLNLSSSEWAFELLERQN